MDMQTQTRNPLHWLMLLVTLLACLAVQSPGQKTASGQIYGLQSASWSATELQAAPRLGLRGLVEEIVSAPPVGANGGVGSIANVRAISAEEANAPFVAKGWNPPYDAGSQVRTFTTTSEVGFVRVSTADNPQGAFLVRADEVAGMTPQQMQQYLALPKVPTQIADVVVPAGTKMQVGQVAAQPSFGVASKGGTQYQLLNPIPSSSFGTPRPIK